MVKISAEILFPCYIPLLVSVYSLLPLFVNLAISGRRRQYSKLTDLSHSAQGNKESWIPEKPSDTEGFERSASPDIATMKAVQMCEYAKKSTATAHRTTLHPAGH